MKNIFFSLLILSSSLIYSTDIKINVKKKEELQPLHEQKISSSYLDEEAMDFDIQTPQNERRWKIVKGLAGLWLGTKFFFCGSKGVLFLLVCPNDMLSKVISRSFTISSPVEKLLTNRFLWLSLCGTLTAFSLWILQKSATNLYQGVCATEDTIEYFEKNL